MLRAAGMHDMPVLPRAPDMTTGGSPGPQNPQEPLEDTPAEKEAG